VKRRNVAIKKKKNVVARKKEKCHREKRKCKVFSVCNSKLHFPKVDIEGNNFF